MAINKSIIAIEAPVTITAAITEGESKGPAKFDATFYTGGTMEIIGYDLPVVIDLSGLSRGNVLVANLDHDSTKRVGNFDVTNDGKILVAHGTASAATDARREVIESAKENYQWQASLEVKPHQIETLGKGKQVEVNGQTVTGPAYITRKGTLKGFAFVSHGADDNTTVAIAASAASQKGSIPMRTEVQDWIKARFPSVDIEALSAEEVANWEADFEGREGKRHKAEKKPTGMNAVTKEMMEAKRREELDAMTASYLSDLPSDFKTPKFVESVQENFDLAIEAGTSPDDYERDLLRSRVPMARTVSAPRGDKGRINDELLTAAICQAGGLQNIDKQFSDETLQTAKDRFKEGIGLEQLFCIAAESNGHRCDNHRVNLEIQRAAFGQLSPIRASTGFSTLSLSGILGATANKFLLEGWGGGEMTWQEVGDINSVRDFKTVTQYKLSGSLKYEKVGPTGEIKHGTVTEGSYTNKADTYGKMFAISREHIVNDDLNALSSIPRELGYGANDAFNEVFWTVFLSGDATFFDSGNNNVSTGVMSSTAGLATIAAAEGIFFAQTKPNGTPLGVVPTVMLMPNGSYRVAQAAMSSPIVAGGSSTLPSSNVFAGEYKVLRSAFLSNSAISGYSTIKWYLLCVRPGFAVIQTSFLNGQRAPMVESAAADFNTLGVQMRGVHDFGVSLFEPRAGVQGTGA